MNLALFDFDGTITTREMLPDFYRFAIRPRRWAVGKILLAPLVVGYKTGLVSGVVLRAVVAWLGFARIPVAEFADCGKRFASEVLPGVLRPEAMARIRWHKAQGDRVIVVSGALDVYLKHWCASHELELICSSFAQAGDVLTGRYRGQQCVRAEKSRRVAELVDLSQFPVVYAYGDTHEDLDLLALAHRKFYQWQEVSASDVP